MPSNAKSSNWLALIGLSLANFLGMFDLTTVNTALPAIQSEFHASIADLQWVMNILLLALTASMVILGKLADLHGRRLFLFIGFALFALSSAGAGLAPTTATLILCRFIQGLGIALLYTTPMAIIPTIFSADQQGKAMGILIGVSSFGLAFGPALGGIFVSTIGWRWIFLINPPIVLLCFLFCWKSIAESKTEQAPEKMDWLGFLLLLISVPMFVLGLVESQTRGFANPVVIGLIAAALIGVFLLCLVETRVPAPIIQLSLLKRRIYLVGLVANFSLAAFYAIDFFLIPLYLNYVRGQSGNEIGFTLLPTTLMVAVLSPIAGKLVDKHGARPVLLFGLCMLCASALLQTQFNADTQLALVILAYLMFGTGWAAILTPSITAAISSVPPENGGVAAGTLGTFHNLSGALGLTCGTLIFSAGAFSSLQTTLSAMHLATGSWLKTASTNMGEAVDIITANSPLTRAAANSVFDQFFINGYASAMYLLVALPLLTLLFVLLGYRQQSRSAEDAGSIVI
ncbi:EmrB/QacA subfamily drug resistance transporter [Oxalobacteraceae bacterium GrIS 2.11]